MLMLCVTHFGTARAIYICGWWRRRKRWEFGMFFSASSCAHQKVIGYSGCAMLCQSPDDLILFSIIRQLKQNPRTNYICMMYVRYDIVSMSNSKCVFLIRTIGFIYELLIIYFFCWFGVFDFMMFQIITVMNNLNVSR